MNGEDLYSAALKELARESHPMLEASQAKARRSSPLCGDRVDFSLNIAEGRITGAGCTVRGCLLCQASASLLQRHILGLDRPALRCVLDDLRRYLAGDDTEPAWPDWQVFNPVRRYPSRHSCVTLPLETALDALDKTVPGQDVAALVLAAGASSRMAGGNKLGLAWGENTVLGHVLRRVSSLPGLAQTIVVGRPGQDLAAACGDLPIRQVLAKDADEGMSASLRAGMAALPSDIGAVLVCLGDMPLVSPVDIQAVLAAWQAHQPAIVRPRWQGRPGHPVLFRHDLFGQLCQVQGDQGARGVIAAHAAQVCFVDAQTDGVVVDVDTHEDYLVALSRRGLSVDGA